MELIVVDLQEDFRYLMDDNYIERIKHLLTYCHIFGIPMHFVKSNYSNVDNESCDTHRGKRRMCIPGTEGYNFIKEIRHFIGDNVIEKTYFSSFKQTNLVPNCKKIVVVGVTAKNCVKSTVLDGILLEYNVSIISECIIGNSKYIDEMIEHGAIDLPFSNFIKNTKFVCDDVLVVNDIFPETIYNQEKLNELFNNNEWRNFSINGSLSDRKVDVQALKDSNNNFPIYRNPGDSYIYPKEPTKIIQEMFDYLNSLTKCNFNHVYMKYYPHPNNSIGEHSDKTLDITPRSYIGNVSLGFKKSMTFKNKRTNTTVNVEMPSNSCVFIGMESNKNYLHQVKSAPALKNESIETQGRLSFTFRTIGSFYDGNKIYGIGAPTGERLTDEELEKDRLHMLKSFSIENRTVIDRNELYTSGFWSLHT